MSKSILSCRAISKRSYICTLHIDHAGLHRAYDCDDILQDAWPQEKKEPIINPEWHKATHGIDWAVKENSYTPLPSKPSNSADLEMDIECSIWKTIAQRNSIHIKRLKKTIKHNNKKAEAKLQTSISNLYQQAKDEHQTLKHRCEILEKSALTYARKYYAKIEEIKKLEKIISDPSMLTTKAPTIKQRCGQLFYDNHGSASCNLCRGHEGRHKFIPTLGS